MPAIPGGIGPNRVTEFAAPQRVVADALVGAIAWTQTDDSWSAAGTVLVSGSIAWTQGSDTWALSGALAVSGTIAWTQAANSWSLTGTSAASGTTTTEVGGVGKPKPWEQRWRQELIELLDLPLPDEDDPKVPAKVAKAIQRVLAKAPPDDAAAIKVLRIELDRLRTPYRAQYVQALRVEAIRKFDDEEEVILLLLH